MHPGRSQPDSGEARSARVSSACPPAGLVLAPFRGVRYAPERVSGLAAVTSPPYDLLGPVAAEELRDADPHNVVRLTLPAREEGDGEPGGRYGVAGRTIREWIADGILVADADAGLYVYEERAARPIEPSGGLSAGSSAGSFAGSSAGSWAAATGPARPGLQRGLIGAIALTPPAAGIVLPHEGVTPFVVADRRRLMEATEANLEPIFLVYEGGGAASYLVDEVADSQPPMIEADTGGMTHRLWAVTDPARVAAASADLARRQALIADGHHRYAAYLELQARRHAEGHGSGPWDYGLALLVDSEVYPPRIYPIHRVVAGLTPAAAAERAGTAFGTRSLPPGTGLDAALRILREAGEGMGGHGAGGPVGGRRTAFLLAGDGRYYLLTDPDPAQLAAAAPAGRSERWLRLDTSVLHELLIKQIWGIRDDQDVRMVHHDAATAIRAAAPAGTAVICNPPLVADVVALAARGEQLPRKSTSFGPKPRTGLVIRSFAYG
jgi:uncharacterized protein (DUF1015 family)